MSPDATTYQILIKRNLRDAFHNVEVLLLLYLTLITSNCSGKIKDGTGADLGLLAGGSQSVVVICRSTYEPGGRARRHMYRFCYRRVNISRLLMLQCLH